MILENKFFRAILALLILGLLCYAGLIIKIYNYVDINEAQNADAIVVMGASQWNGRPSPIFRARLDHAFSLYQKKFAPKFILTGGVGQGEIMSESQVGKNYLIQKGIKEENIFIEERGHTSLQSLNQAIEILKNENLESVILVSDGFHMMRLKKMAKDLKINAYLSAVAIDSVNKLSEFKYVLRESWVYLLYLLFRI